MNILSRAKQLSGTNISRSMGTIGRRLASTTATWPSVAIVGVGQLGAAVASNLIRHNVDLTLFDVAGPANIPNELQDDLAGASWSSSAKEAAERSEVVITALPRPEHVTAAFNGQDGILAGLRSGATWIEHSTTDFENTAVIREQVEAKGAHAVEAPLTGGMQILREGKMVTLVGADPSVFEGTIADLVALSAPRIVRCGEFGHATIIKIFSNMLCAAHDVAIGETLCACRKAGLDMKLVFDAMRLSSGNSFCWETEVPRMLKGDYFPDFTAQMMHKDIGLGLELGERYGVPMPLNSLLSEKYEEAMDIYGADSGSAIPCRLIEDASGCRLVDGDGSEVGDDFPGNQFPGNTLAPHSHGGAFEHWSYTSEVHEGSYTIVHTGYDNPYLQSPFTPEPEPADSEVERLRRRVAELEAQLGSE